MKKKKCWNTSLSRHSSYSIVQFFLFSCFFFLFFLFSFFFTPQKWIQSYCRYHKYCRWMFLHNNSDIWIPVEDWKHPIFLREELERKWSESDSVFHHSDYVWKTHTHFYLLAGELVLRRTNTMKWPVQYCCCFFLFFFFSPRKKKNAHIPIIHT